MSLLVGLQNREALDPLVAEELDFLIAAMVAQFNTLSAVLKTESGTWTPVLGGEGGTSGQTYARQIGSYFKIGPKVFCDYYIELTTAGTLTGNVVIKGLPFVSAGSPTATGSVQVGRWAGLATNWNALTGYVPISSQYGYVLGTTVAAASTVFLADADIGNATTLWGTVQYLAVT